MFSRRAALQGSLLVGFAGALPIARSWAQTPAALNPQLDGDISPVHDPSIIREGDTYYVFSTNLEAAPVLKSHGGSRRTYDIGKRAVTSSRIYRLGRSKPSN